MTNFAGRRKPGVVWRRLLGSRQEAGTRRVPALRSVDGAVHAASAEKPVVGRVDDGVYVLFCVSIDETQAIFSFSMVSSGEAVSGPPRVFLSYTTDSMAPRY